MEWEPILGKLSDRCTKSYKTTFERVQNNRLTALNNFFKKKKLAFIYSTIGKKNSLKSLYVLQLNCKI